MTAHAVHGGIIPFRSPVLVERDADTGCVVGSRYPTVTGLRQIMLGAMSGEKRSDSSHQGWDLGDHAKRAVGIDACQ